MKKPVDKPISRDEFARRLGARVSIPLQSAPVRGPQGFDALLREVTETLARPLGATGLTRDHTVKRLVRFRPSVWRMLKEAAKEAAKRGAPISPAQLAALAIEFTLKLQGQVEPAIKLERPPVCLQAASYAAPAGFTVQPKTGDGERRSA